MGGTLPVCLEVLVAGMSDLRPAAHMNIWVGVNAHVSIRVGVNAHVSIRVGVNAHVNIKIGVNARTRIRASGEALPVHYTPDLVLSERLYNKTRILASGECGIDDVDSQPRHDTAAQERAGCCSTLGTRGVFNCVTLGYTYQQPTITEHFLHYFIVKEHETSQWNTVMSHAALDSPVIVQDSSVLAAIEHHDAIKHCGVTKEYCEVTVEYCDDTKEHCDSKAPHSDVTIQHCSVKTQHFDGAVEHCDVAGTIMMIALCGFEASQSVRERALHEESRLATGPEHCITWRCPSSPRPSPVAKPPAPSESRNNASSPTGQSHPGAGVAESLASRGRGSGITPATVSGRRCPPPRPLRRLRPMRSPPLGRHQTPGAGEGAAAQGACGLAAASAAVVPGRCVSGHSLGSEAAEDRPAFQLCSCYDMQEAGVMGEGPEASVSHSVLSSASILATWWEISSMCSSCAAGHTTVSLSAQVGFRELGLSEVCTALRGADMEKHPWAIHVLPSFETAAKLLLGKTPSPGLYISMKLSGHCSFLPRVQSSQAWKAAEACRVWLSVPFPPCVQLSDTVACLDP
ncbi:LOW QUALITY PROTEIN: hypothetical protein ACRRTK_011743 [Alexandromys fortis]